MSLRVFSRRADLMHRGMTSRTIHVSCMSLSLPFIAFWLEHLRYLAKFRVYGARHPEYTSHDVAASLLGAGLRINLPRMHRNYGACVC